MAQELEINLNELTLGEIEKIEDLSGERIGAAFRGDMSAKMILALVTITKQRSNPEFTMDDARALRFDVLTDVKVEADADPSGDGA